MATTFLHSATQHGDFVRLGLPSCSGELPLLPWVMTRPKGSDVAGALIEMMKRDLVLPALRARTQKRFVEVMKEKSRTLFMRLEALRMLLPDQEGDDETLFAIAEDLGGLRWRSAVVDGLAHLRRANALCVALPSDLDQVSDFQRDNIVAQAGTRMAWTWGIVCMVTMHEHPKLANTAVRNGVLRMIVVSSRAAYISARLLELGEGADIAPEDLEDEALALEALDEMSSQGSEPIPWDRVRASLAG